jgi:polar amino acid transport system substrate-binding protein
VFAEAINSENVKITPDDNISIIVKLANGSVGNIVYLANGDKGMPKEKIEVFGAGMIGVINDFRDGVFYRGGKVIKLKSNGKGHREEIIRFLDSVKKGDESPISFRSVCLTTLTTFRIIDSLRTGLPQIISLDV